jgi:hypothetical protein
MSSESPRTGETYGPGKSYRFAGKIGQPFVRTRDFPSERNTHVYFRVRKISRADKGLARAREPVRLTGQLIRTRWQCPDRVALSVCGECPIVLE